MWALASVIEYPNAPVDSPYVFVTVSMSSTDIVRQGAREAPLSAGFVRRHARPIAANCWPYSVALRVTEHARNHESVGGHNFDPFGNVQTRVAVPEGNIAGELAAVATDGGGVLGWNGLWVSPRGAAPHQTTDPQPASARGPFEAHHEPDQTDLPPRTSLCEYLFEMCLEGVIADAQVLSRLTAGVPARNQRCNPRLGRSECMRPRELRTAGARPDRRIDHVDDGSYARFSPSRAVGMKRRHQHFEGRTLVEPRNAQRTTGVQAAQHRSLGCGIDECVKEAGLARPGGANAARSYGESRSGVN